MIFDFSFSQERDAELLQQHLDRIEHLRQSSPRLCHHGRRQKQFWWGNRFLSQFESFWGNNLILFVSILFALAESALYNTVIKTFITPSDRYLLIQRRNFHIIKGSISFLFNLLTKPHLLTRRCLEEQFSGELYPAHLLHIFPYVHYPFYRISLCARFLKKLFIVLNNLTSSSKLVMIIDDCSIFLIISVAIERYLAVCRPHHYREIQTDSSRCWC